MLRSVSVLTFGTVSFKTQRYPFSFSHSRSGALTVPAQGGQSLPGPRLSHYIFWHRGQKGVLRRKKAKNEYISQLFPVALAHCFLIHDGEQETSNSRSHADDIHAHFQVLPLKNLPLTVSIVKPCTRTPSTR